MNRLTQKQETFTLNLFQGMSQRDAYVSAGYSPKQSPATIDRHACELAKTDKILARREELRQAAEDATIMSVIERKQRLSEIARARLTDYSCCGPDGDQINIGPESPNTAALQEIASRTEYDDDGDHPTVVTRIKLHNPMTAIAELNKMERIYEVGSSVLVNNQILTIIVRSEHAKNLTERLIAGDRVEGEYASGDDGHQDL